MSYSLCKCLPAQLSTYLLYSVLALGCWTSVAQAKPVMLHKRATQMADKDCVERHV